MCHPGAVLEVRQARSQDQPALRRIDTATWTADVSPALPPPADTAFFSERRRPSDVLVAEIDRTVAGYAALGQSLTLTSHAHVLEIQGLAVDPARQRYGAGRRLIHASIEQARSRHARKLALRVLSTNPTARQLYESCGFLIEGILREEFFLAGRYVDDILMARSLHSD